LTGVICDSLTFYNANFEINKELNSILIRHLLTNDANSILLFGLTGDGILFSDKIEQKIRLIELTHNLTEGKIPIIIGIYSNEVEDILNKIESIKKKYNSLHFMISPPFLEQKSIDELKLYFENILNSIDLKTSIYLYNNPQLFSKNSIEPIILEKLIKISNLKGFIDSSYNLKNWKSYLQLLSKDFSVYCGTEENFKDFLQMIPIERRKYGGIVSSISNIVNICSKIYYYALEDNILELLQLQEQLNDIKNKLYDFKAIDYDQKRGLKFALIYLYRDLLSKSSEEIIDLVQKNVEPITKERIEATVNYLINHKQIYQLYSIGKNQIYQFHEIIKKFSNIDELVKHGKVRKIKGPYFADENTIYRVNFQNSQLLFRFRTSKFFQFENFIKEKLLFPFLDKQLTPNMHDLREKVKEISNKKVGSYYFKKENPPIIPVSDLIYFDESKEFIPYSFSVQNFIHGKTLNHYLNQHIIEDTALTKTKFINLFYNLGEYLGKLHEIRFESYYPNILNIGKKQKISYLDYKNEEFEYAIREAQKNKISFIDNIREYYRDNKSLIEDEAEFVLLHNDFQCQNIIVQEDLGVIKINGFIDFDNWCIGSRAQDFIKLGYFTMKQLKIPSFLGEMFTTYSKYHKIDKEFRKKIELYELIWLLELYNIENDLKRKENHLSFQNKTTDSLEKYIIEMKNIINIP